MKTTFSVLTKKMNFLPFFCLILFCSFMEGQAQTAYILKNYSLPTNSSLFEYVSGTNKKLGFGFLDLSIAPRAKFHLISDPTTWPVLKIVGDYQELTIKDSIELCALKSFSALEDTRYGIFQNGPSGGKNFFSYNVGIGVLNPTHTLDVSGTGNFTGSLYTKGDLFLNRDVPDGPEYRYPFIQCQDGIDFYVIGAGIPGPVMTLKGNSIVQGIGVNGHLFTQTFQLNANKGINRVLVSGADGVGTWTNPAWTLTGNDLITNNINYTINNVQVNKDYNKAVLGSFNGLTTATSYIGINAIRQGINWTVSSDGNFNGGNIIWGDVYGNLRISNIKTSASSGSTDQYPTDNEVYSNTKLLITKDGNVAIGLRDPEVKYQDYLLAVNGKIICNELKVRLYADWPDYVFKDGYTLMPLNEVENFINEHHHLSEMPSAEEIAKNGLSVGEINLVLVKKVEELTKYLIEQQKQIEELKKKIENL